MRLLARARSCASGTSALTLLVPALLLLVGHALILQRSSNGPTPAMRIRGDTLYYVAMIQGDFHNVPAPFRHRVLVPFLARLLPVSSTEALRIITYASLFLSYMLILRICLKLGLKAEDALVGLCAGFGTRWHLYNYHNPFLTDGFALMMLCLMIFALMRNSFILFCAAAVLGVLARETTIFLVPAWVVRHWRKGLIVTLLAVAAFLAPRWFLGSDARFGGSLADAFANSGFLRSPLSWAGNMLEAWGWLWLLLVMGFLLLRAEDSLSLWIVFMALVAGAVITSLLAADTGRMCSVLLPIVAISSGQLFAKLRETRHLFFAWFMVMMVGAQIFLSFPNVIFGEQPWPVELYRRSLSILQWLWGVAVLLHLRAEMILGTRAKVAFLLHAARMLFRTQNEEMN